MIDPNSIPRVPLRIAPGWFVKYNELREIDPETLSADDPRWGVLKQDLLQFDYRNDDLILDVGWYPDNDPSGAFGVVVIAERDWDRPLVDFDTRSLTELVAYLEALFPVPPELPVARLVERLSGGTSERRCAAAEQLARRGAVEAIDAISAALRTESIPATYDRLKEARATLIRLGVQRGDNK